MKHLNQDSRPSFASSRRSAGRHAAPKRSAVRKHNAEETDPPSAGTESRAGKSRRRSAKKRRILAIVFLSLAAVLAAALIAYLFHLNGKQTDYEQLARMAYGVSQAYPSETESSSPPASPSPEASSEELAEASEPAVTPDPGPAEIPIDFDYLCSINDDIIGWILVDGTDIDYPILYDRAKNWSYINHDYLLDYSFSGSIYIKDENTSDFSDFNTVIYGHNMNNGSMFAPLHNFREEEFFEEHDTIVIYTPDRKLTYRIFAAYRTDNKNLSVAFEYDTAEQREEYLAHVYSHTKIAFYDTDVSVTAEDKIITLSTCINHQAAYRYLVQAVLISDQPGA